MSTTTEAGGIVRSRVYSRIGLLGNPSDGFGGACLSLSLRNYHAEVTLTPSTTVRFLPHPESDPLEFSSPDSFVTHASSAGLYGGLRLLQAMCLRLFQHCRQAGIQLPSARGNFTLAYTTTIPRQRGLSGSSAIATAALNCLLRFYDMETAVPPAERPQLVLEAEQALGITAGLQDRVIQVYGGFLLMEFDATHMQQYGRGQYRCVDPALLPPLYLLYSSAAPPGKDSGAVHSTVKQRWLVGDTEVRQGMQQLAALAEAGHQALLNADTRRLAQLMNDNFRLRRQLYGDVVVGSDSLAMVEAAASVGAAAKLTGSGGAVVALCPDGESQAERLREACRQRGLECVAVEVGPVLHVADDP